MAGRMGNSNVTVKNAFVSQHPHILCLLYNNFVHLVVVSKIIVNVQLWKIDTKNNLLYVKGQVPGAPGTFIR